MHLISAVLVFHLNLISSTSLAVVMRTWFKDTLKRLTVLHRHQKVMMNSVTVCLYLVTVASLQEYINSRWTYFMWGLVNSLKVTMQAGNIISTGWRGGVLIQTQKSVAHKLSRVDECALYWHTYMHVSRLKLKDIRSSARPLCLVLQTGRYPSESLSNTSSHKFFQEWSIADNAQFAICKAWHNQH